jgi:ABC-type transporter MlaC component
VIGWVGPLFWPYAYRDVVDYAFYPHSYDTFWPYAYDDVYQGVFGAYAYGYDGDDATVGRSSRLTGNGSVAQPPQPAGGVALCATQASTLTDWPIERIAQAVEPDDTQRAALEGLKEATSKSLDILRSNCPIALPSTPTARLAAMRQRLETMLQAVRTIHPALEAFYQTLDDEQKARFNAMGGEGNQDQQQARRDLTQVCGENASGVGHIPLKQIESSLQTSPSQRSVFAELQNAAQQAAESLKANCPEFEALTPTSRVAAIEQRLQAMLQAVQTVEPALQQFYSSLSDEQKERFNRLTPAKG